MLQLTNHLYHPDRHGFYTVGDKFKSYSKLEAIAEMNRTGIHLEWKFNQEIFNSYNWTVEPTESLEELYRQKAQQIRDNFDYVVLNYSGGADSWNVLNTFLKNDIKIDEIAHCWYLEGDKTYYSYYNEEIYRVAIPTTQKILETHPHIKHRVIDQSALAINSFLQKSNKFDWIYYANGFFSANNLSRGYLREDVDDYKKMLDQGKKVAFVWGTDKPKLNIKNGKYSFMFVDQLIEGVVNPYVQNESLARGYYDDLFYWTPESAKILIKQAHIMKRFLDNAPLNSPWLMDFDKTLTNGPSKKGKKWMTKEALHTLIYPGWDINTFTRGKHGQTIGSPRDGWINNRQDHELPNLKIFRNGVKKVMSDIGTYWLKDEFSHDPLKGVKGCINEYFIE